MVFYYILLVFYIILRILTLDQGSPNFFVREPHKLLHNSSRAGHLTYCDCFWPCCILPNQQIIRKSIIFSLLTKWFRGPDLARGP